MLRWTYALSLAIVSVACAAPGPSARVRPEPPPVDQLAGQWEGTYSVESGAARGGTIAFALETREGSVAGRARLLADGAPTPYQLSSSTPTADAGRAASDSLILRVLTASDGLMYADLDPYWDAARGTAAAMTLRGQLQGDALTGTFRTTYADGSEQTLGRWTANRGKNNE